MAPKQVTVRPVRRTDIPTLDRWDRDPGVIVASGDEATDVAFGGHDWQDELDAQSDYFQYYIAELDGRPIGAMLVIDPLNEANHYWGDVEPNLRAVDIWIGDDKDRGRGYGEQMMRWAFKHCFADPAVAAIIIDPLNSNVRACKFYQRLGFEPTHRQTFGEDDCLVHKLTRQAWRQMFPNDAM